MRSLERLRLELRRSGRSLAIFIGFCACAVVAFVVIFNNLTFQRPWESYRTVRIAADDVKGIFPGKHQVRISGVKVGVVSSADLEDGEPVLTLRIGEQFGPIYRDARIRIRPVTPLQDLYVNITDRGTEAAGEADSDYVIPAENTITPVDISRVLNTFDADTRDRLTVLLTEFGRGLDDGGEKLRASFVELAPFLVVARKATRVLAEHEYNVRRIVHNFGTLSAALAQRDEQLMTLVRSGNASLAELANNDVPLAATIGEIPSTLAEMRASFASLRSLSDELDPTLSELDPVTANLESGLAALQQFGAEATPALAALRPALGELRRMAHTLPATSRSLEGAFRRLNGQAPAYKRLVQELVPCRDMMQDFFNHTLSVFKFEDGLGAFPRAEMTVDLDGFSDGEIDANTRPLETCIKQPGVAE